jgi:hypothetical protein
MRHTRSVWLALLFSSLSLISLCSAEFPGGTPTLDQIRRWIAGTWSPAEERYLLAERYFQAGAFEKSLNTCEQGLLLDPGHAAILALWTEVQFILARPAPQVSQRDQELLRVQHTLIEMDSTLELAGRAFVRGDFVSAERGSFTVLQSAQGLPIGVEVKLREQLAIELLARVRRRY